MQSNKASLIVVENVLKPNTYMTEVHNDFRLANIYVGPDVTDDKKKC